jgi:DNA-binding NarL/FixJ family response regulator
MSRKVLIVDDSKLARMVVGRALTALRPGWIQAEAANAAEATLAASATAFDLALVDFNMPGDNGLQLARRLAHLSPTTKVALVTANAQNAIIEAAAAIDAHFVMKPLTSDALEKILDHLFPSQSQPA